MRYFFILLLSIILNGAAADTNVNMEKPVKTKESGTLTRNILYISALPSPSHHIWNRSLMKALANEGYNLTAISPDIDKKPTPNLNYIHMEGVYECLYHNNNYSVDLLNMSFLGPVDDLRSLYELSLIICKCLVKSNGFKTLLQYPKDFKFDLFIYDVELGPCLFPFIDRFQKAPLISVSPFLYLKMGYFSGSVALFPMFLPYYNLKLPANMNFFQRLQNVIMYTIDFHYMKAMIKDQDAMLREYFGPDMKTLSSFAKRSELYLVNSHTPMQHPELLLPNVVQVGGMQIQKPSPLPEDIEHFISSSEKGAVFFSLGTNMKSEMLGEEKVLMFFNVIKRLPHYNFLWKFEADTLPTLPKNLMIRKWFPQNDILAHPKIILFLSHTGLLSSQEATWYGVPVLAMPFLIDQPYNTFRMVEDGVAEKLDFLTLTEDKIYTTMKKMFENSSYGEKMKLRSIQFRERPQDPLDLALFWCKYVIRNGNAEHLRSPALEMSIFVQHMWDVLLALVGAALAIIFLICKLICYFIRKRSSSKIKTN